MEEIIQMGPRIYIP